MGLTKIRLGDYIERSTANNKNLVYGTDLIVGVTNEGIFTAPKGNPIGVDLRPYKIVNHGAFVYNPTRLDLGSIAYREDGLCIVSHLYIVFYLNEAGKKIIDPQYLFIYFRRKEFCREVTFRNFGSQRPEFSFSDMCDIVVPLPPYDIQQKYVAIYNAMLANQQSYERGLEDLKCSFEALIDRYKHIAPKKAVGKILHEVDNRNDNGSITDVQGINIEKRFMSTIANTTDVNLSKYKVVRKGQFAFSGMQTGRDQCIRIALFDKDDPIIISPAYTVLEPNDSSVLPEYIMMWFTRKEVDRRGGFMSDASIRTNLDLDRFYEIKIPVPEIEIQQDIVDIFKAYNTRKGIAETLKNQIQNICPILIKGSIEEAQKTDEA